MDIGAAFLGMLLLFPFMLIIAVMIKLSSKGPVLYRQLRPGLNERVFCLYKFRSMRDLRDGEGNVLPDEMRLTRIGRILRRLSLDEIPELWNVLRGELSLVGPRPLLIRYLDRYTEEQARRHEVQPGLTGWAQVMGRNAIPWEERFQHDLWYIDNWSLWLDIKIIFMTFIMVLKGKGVSQPGRATMDEFKGEAGPPGSMGAQTGRLPDP